MVSTELEEHAVLAEGVVKMLSGGDTISARELYGRRFNFRPTHKLLLVTNHRPRVSGVDNAIWRRLRVVPFSVTIPTDRQDPNLRQRLVEEHTPAIVAWLVEGAVEWSRSGIGEAEAVNGATHEYRASQDVLGAWLDEFTERVDKARTKVGDLFDAWREWCSESAEAPGRRQDFVPALQARGVEVRKAGNNRLAIGVSLRSEDSEHSSRTFPNSTSTGTLRMSAIECSHPQVEGPDLNDDDLARMFSGEL